MDGQPFYGGAQEGVCFHERIHTAVFYFVERQGSYDTAALARHADWRAVQLLQLRGLPGDAIARAIDPYVECRCAKNDNRAAMGCMNDLVGRYQSMIDYMGGLARCDLTEIIFKMNNMPQRTIGWAYSWEVAESKLRALS